MKFTNTVAAAKAAESGTWGVADALVLDFKEAGVKTPTLSHYEEAAEALEAFDYGPRTIQEYWQAAFVFGKNRRKAGVPLGVYTKLTIPLWSRLDPETRGNDLVHYATQFFAEYPKTPAARYTGDGEWSSRKATAWANAQGAALDAERKKRLEAEAKKKVKVQLAEDERAMDEAIAEDDMKLARRLLVHVNEGRRRLGLDLLKLEETKEEVAVEVDEEATEQAQEETEAEQADRLHAYAVNEIEKAIAGVGQTARFLGNTYRRVQEHLTDEDLDAYAEEIELVEGRLALIRSQISGTTSDKALAAALAKWESEAASG